MNKLSKQENDILKVLSNKDTGSNVLTQRELADKSGYSLGVVNQSLKALMGQGLIDSNQSLSKKAKELFESSSPKRAIILAAGFGMRMVPINVITPKAFLEVKGETLIERHIRQLHEVGITEIYVVVGFMKEQFDYLIDEYGVELIVNTEYTSKNNLFSLQKALAHISNTYIIPCDIYCDFNPYSARELYSWYMISDNSEVESDVRINRKQELVKSPSGIGNRMVGISYITSDSERELVKNIKELCETEGSDDFFWENALYKNDRMILHALVTDDSTTHEINTYEQLRDLDSDSEYLKSDAMAVIAETLGVNETDITEISILKKGMTNRSFIFTCKDKKYIMRIPGEGTELLINRKQEAYVYSAIKGKGLCDDPVYINPENGYKITEYLENVRVCDYEDDKDLSKCMTLLKKFHDMKLEVDHEFDIFGQIDFYESLWNGLNSSFRDYEKTKENVLSLKELINKYEKEKILTHIDANHDNFLFYDSEGTEKLQLTDWEYAGMQDPDVDLAMFSIYAGYDKKQADHLIDIYYDGHCDDGTRRKIYAYMAASGLLWSNWCEYKRTLGVEFGEYNLIQYRYAKDFYKYATQID